MKNIWEQRFKKKHSQEELLFLLEFIHLQGESCHSTLLLFSISAYSRCALDDFALFSTHKLFWQEN